MTGRKRPAKPPPFPDMPFEEALARLLQTDPRELPGKLAEEFVRAKDKAEKEVREIDRYVEERRSSIRKGARRDK